MGSRNTQYFPILYKKNKEMIVSVVRNIFTKDIELPFGKNAKNSLTRSA